MIYGIGTDIVQCSRFLHWVDTPMATRFFHPNELSYIKQKGSSAIQSMAARFAAKEALGKALGTGLIGLSLREIEVVQLPLGRPGIQLHGTTKSKVESLGNLTWWLTLSHERDYATATVLVEKE